MSTQRARRQILVGVDGSDSALQAVRWAAMEADRRRVPLRLLHGFEWPTGRHVGDVRVGAPYREVLIRQARGFLAQAAETAKAVAPGVELTADLRVAHPVELLAYESRAAQLVVLGSRGLGGFTGLLIGSVAVGVVAHGACPVVVVRGRDADPATPGPVVVGVDGSPTSEAALAFAYDAADARDAQLIAVHAWQNLADEVFEPDMFEEEEREVLAERLAGWAQKYPDVPVRRLVVQGGAAHALLRAAEGAALVVVGSRGRGGFTGLLLGSTSQALIRHASCPVAVVRMEDADKAGEGER